MRKDMTVVRCNGMLCALVGLIAISQPAWGVVDLTSAKAPDPSQTAIELSYAGFNPHASHTAYRLVVTNTTSVTFDAVSKKPDVTFVGKPLCRHTQNFPTRSKSRG